MAKIKSKFKALMEKHTSRLESVSEENYLPRLLSFSCALLTKHLPAESHAPLLPNNLFSTLNCLSAHRFGFWGHAGGRQSFTAEFLTLSPQDASVLASSCQWASQPRGRRSKPGFKPLTHSSQCDGKPSLTHRGPVPVTHSPLSSLLPSCSQFTDLKSPHLLGSLEKIP